MSDTPTWDDAARAMFEAAGMHEQLANRYAAGMFRLCPPGDSATASRIISWFQRGLMFPFRRAAALPDWVSDAHVEQAVGAGVDMHDVCVSAAVAGVDTATLSALVDVDMVLAGRVFARLNSRYTVPAAMVGSVRDVLVDVAELPPDQARPVLAVLADGEDADVAAAIAKVLSAS